ncbi:MAG: hypothetical protein ACTS27_11425 [Phycisphaerales bacterium]
MTQRSRSSQRTARHRRSRWIEGESAAAIVIGILGSLALCCCLVAFGVPILVFGGLILFSPTPVPLYGCVAFVRDDEFIGFVNECSGDNLYPPFEIERTASLRWGGNERTGMMWMRVGKPSQHRPDTQWLLFDACSVNRRVRQFDSPEELLNVLMRDYGILVDVETTLQPVPRPETWFW